MHLKDRVTEMMERDNKGSLCLIPFHSPMKLPELAITIINLKGFTQDVSEGFEPGNKVVSFFILFVSTTNFDRIYSKTKPQKPLLLKSLTKTFKLFRRQNRKFNFSACPTISFHTCLGKATTKNSRDAFK